jgi:hypothetical protein
LLKNSAVELERHVPGDHLLRVIDRFVDRDSLRARLAQFYISMGRPSIDPGLLIPTFGGLLLRHQVGATAL